MGTSLSHKRGAIAGEHGGPRARLPELVMRGLAGHDRLKYYLRLLETAAAYARHPNHTPLTLRSEREASGIQDASLDAIVGASRMVTDALIRIPHAAAILDRVFATVSEMLEPITAASSWREDLAARASLYQDRLDQLVAHVPPCTDDQMSPAAMTALMTRSANGHDSIYQLSTDLRRELGRLQTNMAVESVDGAQAYGLSEDDRILIRVFMQGINDTAPLRLDHQTFDTSASRDREQLVIRTELEAAQGHVLYVHVSGFTAAVIYADPHRPRAAFFRDLLQPYAVRWEEEPSSNEHIETSHGGFTAAGQADLEAFLTHLGSRLVFLIDWVRARTRLSRLVKNGDAVMLLKWAADNNIGHSAFLRGGDTRLVYGALERAAPSQLRHPPRLDELLGRDAARLFMMSVFRIAWTGLSAGRSPRLIDDEVEAELLPYLQRSDRIMLGAAADHAMVIAGAIEWVGRAVSHVRAREALRDNAVSASRAWRTHADEIVRRTARMLDHSSDLAHFRRLMSDGDRAVKAIEQTAFTLALMPPDVDATALSLLDSLCVLVIGGVRDYVQLLEDARGLRRTPDRAELEHFLAIVDRLVALEDQCDAAAQAVLERLIGSPGDFRELHLLSAITGHLDTAFDALVRSTLTVRDYVLGIAPGS